MPKAGKYQMNKMPGKLHISCCSCYELDLSIFEHADYFGMFSAFFPSWGRLCFLALALAWLLGPGKWKEEEHRLVRFGFILGIRLFFLIETFPRMLLLLHLRHEAGQLFNISLLMQRAFLFFMQTALPFWGALTGRHLRNVPISGSENCLPICFPD